MQFRLADTLGDQLLKDEALDTVLVRVEGVSSFRLARRTQESGKLPKRHNWVRCSAEASPLSQLSHRCS